MCLLMLGALCVCRDQGCLGMQLGEVSQNRISLFLHRLFRTNVMMYIDGGGNTPTAGPEAGHPGERGVWRWRYVRHIVSYRCQCESVALRGGAAR